MANYVYIATSLDGYIATADGGIEWLTDIPNPSKSDYGYADFIARVDAIVMGTNTFEKVLSFEGWYYKKPVYVLTNSLTTVPPHLEGKVQLISGTPEEVIEEIKKDGFENLYMDGGKVVQSFLQRDLVDELIIATIPKILGTGVALFAQHGVPMEFTHIETEVFNNYLIKSRYARMKK